MKLSQIRGIGLIELLVVIGIIGIVATYAIGDNTPVRKRAQINQTAQHFSEALDYARNFSRQTSAKTLLCPGSESDACNTSDWSQGWTLFKVTGTQVGQPRLETIRVFETEANQLQFVLNTPSVSPFLVVDGDGFVQTANDIEFLSCITGLNESIRIDVSPGTHSMTPMSNANLCP